MKIFHCSVTCAGGSQHFRRRKLRRVKQNSTRCKAQPSTQTTFSIEGFDSALERGEIEVCWKQILKLKEKVGGARVSQEEDGSINYDLGVSLVDRLRTDSTSVDLSSTLENVVKGANADEGPSGGLPSVEPDAVTDDLDTLPSEETRGGVTGGDEDANALAEQCTWQEQMLKEILLGRHKKFIKQCIATSRKDLLVEYMQLLPDQKRVFSWLLRECLQAKDCDGVLQVLEIRKEMGLEPDQYSYSALISALVRLGDMEGAKSAFEEAMQKGVTSLYLYNALIDGYGRRGDVDGAMEIWDVLQLHGLEPDAFTYTGMIRAMGTAKRSKEMKSFFDEMIARDLNPMPHTFTIMFDASSACDEQDAEWLFSLCNVMSEFNIQFNDHILSAMITALAQVDLASEQVDFVFDRVDKFRATVGSPTAMVYSSLLLFCGRQGIHERVIDVWNAMQEDGLSADCHAYSAALTTCALDPEGDSLVDFAVQIGSELQEEWRLNRNHDRNSMLIAFNSLINAYTTLCGMGQAMRVYRSMQKNGPKPDLITCNTLISGFSSRGMLKPALRVRDHMSKSGIQASGRTYVALLTCCGRAHDPGLAWNLFQEMVEAGIRAPVEAYTALMDAFVKDGSEEKIDRAFELLEAMKEDGLKPTAVTYGCLLVGCCHSGDVDRAFRLYKEAHESDIVPTDTCHNILINMCTLSGRLDEALEVVKNLAQKHGSIEQDTLNSLIRSLAKSDLNRAIIVLRLMQNRNLEPTQDTYHDLILSCSENAWPGMAVELYKQMRKQGIKGCRRIGSALIKAQCSANRVSDAVLVAVDMIRCSGVQDIGKQFHDYTSSESYAMSQKRAIQDRSQLPDVSALGMLCCGLIQEKHIGRAMQIFRLVKTLEGDQGIAFLVCTVPIMFESLIETSCSRMRVDEALEVFDTWKASITMLLSKNEQPRGDERAAERDPRISQASLNHLRATCQNYPELRGRVREISATIRRQKEWGPGTF